MNISNINNFINVKNDILSNGCDRSGSECHIVGDMSVANFLLLYSFKPYIIVVELKKVRK